MCSIYEKVFIVPQAGILIPVLPEKSGIFYTESHSIIFIEFHRNLYLTHFPLSWRSEQEKAIDLYPDKTKYVKLSRPPNPSCLWLLFKLHDQS